MLSQIYYELRKIDNSTEIKVNYSTSKVIIISHSNMDLSEEDGEKITKYETNFNCNNLDIGQETRNVFFFYTRKATKDHRCILCIKDQEDEDASSSTSSKELSVENDKEE